MDIEKLIEQLHIAGAGNPGNIFDVAATALQYLSEGADEVNAALQEQIAENEKLRAKLKRAHEALDFARTTDAETVQLGVELARVTAERDAAVNEVERTVERYVSLGPYDRLRELSRADQAIGREIFLPNDKVRGTVEGFRAWKDGSISFSLVDGRHRYSLSSDLVYKFLVGRDQE